MNNKTNSIRQGLAGRRRPRRPRTSDRQGCPPDCPSRRLVYDHLVGDAIMDLAAPMPAASTPARKPPNTPAAGLINQLLVDLAREGCRWSASRAATRSSSGAAAKNWKPCCIRHPLRSRPRRHRCRRLRRLCRLSADPSRSRPGRHFRHRPPQGRHGQPRLARTFPPQTDRRLLHGHRRRRRNLPPNDQSRPAFDDPGRRCPQRHPTRPANLLATLGTLPQRIAESGIKPPALIVVGSVVQICTKN
jgi:hypothetical protein